MKQAFRVLDKNHTGCIDVEDLKWILKSLGDDLSDDEIEQMIAETDTDGSGTVDYDGMQCSLVNMQSQITRENIQYYSSGRLLKEHYFSLNSQHYTHTYIT